MNLFIAILMLVQPPQGRQFEGEFAETLARPINVEFTAPGRTEDVEVCIADSIYVAGVPSVFRRGANRVLIAALIADSPGVMVAVDLRQAEPNLVAVQFRARGRWVGILEPRLRSCFRVSR